MDSLILFLSFQNSLLPKQFGMNFLIHVGTRMEAEMDALHHNETEDLVPLLLGKMNVGCKCVYNVKFNPNVFVELLKASLIVKGHTQTYGIDYEETSLLTRSPLLFGYSHPLQLVLICRYAN